MCQGRTAKPDSTKQYTESFQLRHPVRQFKFVLKIKSRRGWWELNLIRGSWYTSETTSFEPVKISKMADRLAKELKKQKATATRLAKRRR